MYSSLGKKLVMVNVQDYGSEIREFELQSCYYIHFQINNLEKGTNPLIPPRLWV